MYPESMSLDRKGSEDEQDVRPRRLIPFDATRYLTDDEAIAEYLKAALEEDDPDLLLLALGDLARARGRGQISRGSRTR